MPSSDDTTPLSRLADLLNLSGHLFARLRGVVRFEPQIFDEIDNDPHAIPQAFAVVIATAVIGSLGQGSLARMFLAIAGMIAAWATATALIWGTATLTTGKPLHFPRLLRCLGFAYVWFVLLIGGNLPLIGSLFDWAAVGLFAASAVLAVRQTLHVDLERALLICGISLLIPILLLLILT